MLFGGGASTDIISILIGSPVTFYVGSSSVSGISSVNFTQGATHSLECYANNGTLTVEFDGTTYSGTYSGSINKEYSLALLGNNVSGNVSMLSNGKIYSCQIYDNGTLVRDYNPALRSDGIAGLYDSVNDTFTASGGSGNFVAGTKVEEVIATQLSVSGKYKIPFGISYAIQAGKVDYYTSPSVYTNIASNVSRVVSVQYVYTSDLGITNPSNGVWIKSAEGKYYTSDNWLSAKTPNGIAVITSNCRFLISLEDALSEWVEWSDGYVLVSSVTVTTDSTVAISDYNGEAQTTTILNVLGNNSIDAPAAYYCRAYTFPDGSVGYLGAAGEWQAVLDNKDEIEAALKICGGTTFSNIYWSCTQYDDSLSWYMDFDAGHIAYAYKSINYRYLRPFATI